MQAATLFQPPSFSLRFVPVWRRNLLVWRKLAIASVLGNIAEPLLYMLALGYGIGALIGEVGGMPYIAFIGTGMVCQSAMFTASFEGMYSAFSRMHMQRTWDAIINAPDLPRRRGARRVDVVRNEGADVDDRDPDRADGAWLRPYARSRCGSCHSDSSSA